jgi:nicotinamide mononucleotide transporter
VTLTPEALKTLEIFATLFGAAYVVLAAMRKRLCWLAGAIGSVLLGVVACLRSLPMQSALQAFYVVMSVYGWWSWTRSAGTGELPVGMWPLSWHIGAALVLIVLTYASARLLASETQAAWPLLDSLTTWFSLLATWLTARARLENWLYWIVIDALLAYLFYVQDAPYLATLFVVYVGVAAAGYVAWRRRYRQQQQQPQQVPA